MTIYAAALILNYRNLNRFNFMQFGSIDRAFSGFSKPNSNDLKYSDEILANQQAAHFDVVLLRHHFRY
jgi:hypothetical protein